MNKNLIKYILGGVFAILILQFVVVPLINRQKAGAVMKDILKSWVTDDSTRAVKYFASPAKSPPIYGLQSYEIKSHKFESVNGKQQVKFWIVLHFSPGNVLPTGKTWICEMTIDKGRWLASSFYLADE